MNTQRTVSALVLALAVAAAVGVALAARDNPLATRPLGRAFLPSDVIFPAQSVPLRFFHDKHLKADMSCTDCHDRAASSVRSEDLLVPHGADGEAICTTCHDVSSGAKADPPSACQTCHGATYQPTFPAGADRSDTSKALNRPAGVVIPTPHIKMNHKVHVAKGIKCTECHGPMTGIQVATRDNALPVMSKCLECHDGRKAPSACRTCHVTRPDGRLQTEFAEGRLQPSGRYRNDAHNEAWVTRHAPAARNDEQYCAQCHEEKFCLKCHNGVLRPLKIHPNNWVHLHSMAARRNIPNCQSCHRTQSFCIQCHKRMRVVTKTEFDATKQGQGFPVGTKLARFHPPDWVGDLKNGSARGRNHHSFQAQRNLRACAACHTERTCVACHAPNGTVGLKAPGRYSGQGINPHGSRFRGSIKCESLLRGNRRVCTKCHQNPTCR